MTHHLDMFMSGKNLGLNGLILDILCFEIFLTLGTVCLYMSLIQHSC